MQAQAGMFPTPQVVFPGQVSAAIATQGPLGAFSALPGQTYQTAVGTPPIYQGPTGIMAPIGPAAPYNPYASLGVYGGGRGASSPFSPYSPNPPPAYGGLQGVGAIPFAPPQPMGSFETPYGNLLGQEHANEQRAWIQSQGYRGIMAHLGANLGGAAAGAYAGRRFGRLGMGLGALGGFFGSEALGLGRGAQNLYGNWVAAPQMASFGAGLGIGNMSQGFISSGADLHESGQGFSFGAAQQAAGGLSALANSRSFRRETYDRFNQQDVFRIAQASGEQGLLTGVGSPQGMSERVRGIARSLTQFMELAREPDVLRAIQTMGSLRSSGLNLNETLSAVQQGRLFARQAGTTFQGLAEIGGALGSQTFQSMGLTQGVGFTAGMAHYGGAQASINRGTLSPQLAAMIGGAQGLSTLNTMFSGSMLQLPMVAPGAMNARGGLDANAVQALLSGRSDLFSMTSRGSNQLSNMAGGMGIGGLGMAIAMQPLLQDSIGRMVQAQGPFAQRHMEDRQIMNLARQMGMGGSTGFLTAAQTLGMSQSQAVARATELGSSGYWQGQHQQLAVQQQEVRAAADRDREQNREGFMEQARRQVWSGSSAQRAQRRLSLGWDRLWDVGDSGTYQYTERDDAARRRMDRQLRSGSFDQYLSRQHDGGLSSGIDTDYALAQARGARGLGALSGALAFQFRPQEERQRLARGYAEAGTFASNFLSATEGEQRRAMGRMDEVFRGRAGAAEFTRRILDQAGGANSLGYQIGGGVVNLGTRALFGVAGSGLIDVGNALGSRSLQGQDLRTAYEATMRGRGMSSADIARHWERDQGTIAAMASHEAAAQGMSRSEREAFEETQRRGADFRTGRTGHGGETRAAYRRVLGDTGVAAQRGFRDVFDQARGVGREGSDQQRASRRAVAALALAQVQMRSGNVEAAALARGRAEQIRSALNPRELFDIDQQATGLADRYEHNDDAQRAARGMFDQRGSGTDILARIGSAEDTLLNEQAGHRLQLGYRSLAGMGREMADVFGGTDGSTGVGTFESRLSHMTEDQLRSLEANPNTRRLAQQIRRAQRSGNFGDLRVSMSRLGEEGERIERRVHERHAGTRSALRTASAIATNAFLPVFAANRALESSGRRSLTSRFTGMLDQFLDRRDASEVEAEMQTRSSSERGASQQRLGAVGAESELQGSNGDAFADLRDVTENLREVTTNLRDITQQRQTDSLLGSVLR